MHPKEQPSPESNDIPEASSGSLEDFLDVPAYGDIKAHGDRLAHMFEPGVEGPSLFQPAREGTIVYDGHSGLNGLTPEDLLAMGFLPPVIPRDDNKEECNHDQYDPDNIDAPRRTLKAGELELSNSIYIAEMNNIFHPESGYDEYRKNQ